MTAMTATRPRIARRPAVNAAGRAGLVARGLVYVLLGWIAIQIAAGHSAHRANQKGALATVAAQPGGTVMLIALAIGLAGYALWRFSQAVFGTPTDGRELGPRLKSLVRGLIYAGLCAIAVGVVVGTRGSSQDKQQADVTARVMQHAGGRWLVGLIGVVVLVVGASMAMSGIRLTFRRELDTARMPRRARKAIVGLGAFGTVARGIVIAVAGALVIAAAVTTDPRKSTGLDGALRTLAHQTLGPWLLGLIALGLIAFGVYGIASAKWTKI
jgi:hypothetical protein